MKTMLTAAIAAVMLFLVTNSTWAATTLVTFSGPGYVSQGQTSSYVPTSVSFSTTKKDVILNNPSISCLVSVTSWTIGSVQSGIEYAYG